MNAKVEANLFAGWDERCDSLLALLRKEQAEYEERLWCFTFGFRARNFRSNSVTHRDCSLTIEIGTGGESAGTEQFIDSFTKEAKRIAQLVTACWGVGSMVRYEIGGFFVPVESATE